ncbi:hypothetical protein IV38_GL001664 [Lactobacillus selangorensis]|uniref:Uncharacterized protein n=1 Tax=Lactobacillus selangorensis TaxID=81857 RepID=A0A0R2FQY2_9LACO|nr:hypothetical protein IV38_GL001664 [Lactobacillus selangorensis]KRN30914.1 hypothetical protein IV40_GL001551 [Lactobacillus selangorensis]
MDKQLKLLAHFKDEDARITQMIADQQTEQQYKHTQTLKFNQERKTKRRQVYVVTFLVGAACGLFSQGGGIVRGLIIGVLCLAVAFVLSAYFLMPTLKVPAADGKDPVTEKHVQTIQAEESALAAQKGYPQDQLGNGSPAMLYHLLDSGQAADWPAAIKQLDL